MGGWTVAAILVLVSIVVSMVSYVTFLMTGAKLAAALGVSGLGMAVAVLLGAFVVRFGVKRK